MEVPGVRVTKTESRVSEPGTADQNGRLRVDGAVETVAPMELATGASRRSGLQMEELNVL